MINFISNSNVLIFLMHDHCMKNQIQSTLQTDKEDILQFKTVWAFFTKQQMALFHYPICGSNLSGSTFDSAVSENHTW